MLNFILNIPVCILFFVEILAFTIGISQGTENYIENQDLPFKTGYRTREFLQERMLDFFLAPYLKTEYLIENLSESTLNLDENLVISEPVVISRKFHINGQGKTIGAVPDNT